MPYYSKGLGEDHQRDINVSFRLNAVIKNWLDRQCKIENLSISSYLYEMLKMFDTPDPNNLNDLRQNLPHLVKIDMAYKKYLKELNVANKYFEEKISIYLDGQSKEYIQDIVNRHKADMSSIIREHIHFFFIADNYFKTNFDLVDDLHNGLLLNVIRDKYFIERFETTL